MISYFSIKPLHRREREMFGPASYARRFGLRFVTGTGGRWRHYGEKKARKSMADPATSCGQSGNERDVTFLSASLLHDLRSNR